MSVILLIVGAGLCSAAEYPLNPIVFYAALLYAAVYDFLGGSK